MADDPGKTPAPRPRRRRTDVDPSYKPPKVANERRRSKASSRATERGSTTPEAPTESPRPPRCRRDRADGRSRYPSRPRPTLRSVPPTTRPTVRSAVRATPRSRGPAGRTGAAGEHGCRCSRIARPILPICPFLRRRRRGADRPARSRRPTPANRCAALARRRPAVAAPAGARLPHERSRQLSRATCVARPRSTEVPPPARPDAGRGLTPADLRLDRRC